MSETEHQLDNVASIIAVNIGSHHANIALVATYFMNFTLTQFDCQGCVDMLFLKV